MHSLRPTAPRALDCLHAMVDAIAVDRAQAASSRMATMWVRDVARKCVGARIYPRALRC